MQFKQWLTENDWYHGSPVDFGNFSYEFLGSGRGHNEHGPGFYFSSEESDARGYGNVKRYKLNIRKSVPTKGRPKLKEVVFMLNNAPSLKEAIMDNWSEDFKQGYHQALQTIMNYSKDPYDAFLNVWVDFYNRYDQNQAFLENLKKLGYDSVVFEKPDFGNNTTIKHVVMFSPEDIVPIQ